MRLPIRSEQDAFRFVVLLVSLGGLVLLVGYLIDPIAAVALLGLIALAVLVWEMTSTDPQRGLLLHEAEQAGHRIGEHRILVIVNEVPRGAAFRDEILGSGDSDRAVLEILAPVLQSRTHFVTTDIDHETQLARRRLSETLEWARSKGIAATGAIGDPIDLRAGIADELRRFDVDRVVVTTGPLHRTNWLEQGMLASLRDELDIPITHLVMDSLPADKTSEHSAAH